MSQSFQSFAEFYPHSLGEHANPTCRRLHFFGSCVALGFLAAAVVTVNAWWLAAALVSGYAFAWAMFRDMLTGRIRF